MGSIDCVDFVLLCIFACVVLLCGIFPVRLAYPWNEEVEEEEEEN